MELPCVLHSADIIQVLADPVLLWYPGPEHILCVYRLVLVSHTLALVDLPYNFHDVYVNERRIWSFVYFCF